MKATKQISRALTATAVGIVMMGMACAVSAGIANTRHNLGSSGSFTNTYSNTSEICVFCHTPHGSDNSASVPLWNRTLNDPASYTTYDTLGTSTLDGEIENVGSVSLACLSCHDGQTALDVLLNEPGSGADVPGFSGGTWGGGTGYPTGIRLLGTDLTNDHPIGVQYGGGGITTTTPSPAQTNDPDFKITANAQINNQTVWWVDTSVGSTNVREKTDMLLYTRVGTTSGEKEPFVECASCHDPHTENTTFLRLANNDNSQVCLSCHTK